MFYGGTHGILLFAPENFRGTKELGFIATSRINNIHDQRNFTLKYESMKVEIILSIVLATSTVFYTIISLMLWFESRATRKQKTTPLIIAFLKSTENHQVLALHIKNIGEGLAKNVKIIVLKDYNRLGKNDLTLSNIGIVKNGFNNFPPQHELSFYIDLMTDLEKEEDKNIIEIEINYESFDKKKYHDTFKLPFNQVTGQNYSNPPETFIGQIPYYLKEINNTLKENSKKNQ